MKPMNIVHQMSDIMSHKLSRDNKFYREWEVMNSWASSQLETVISNFTFCMSQVGDPKLRPITL